MSSSDLLVPLDHRGEMFAGDKVIIDAVDFMFPRGAGIHRYNEMKPESGITLQGFDYGVFPGAGEPGKDQDQRVGRDYFKIRNSFCHAVLLKRDRSPTVPRRFCDYNGIRYQVRFR